jgi:hypothetical protein
MKLFVRNCTNQTQRVMYRLDIFDRSLMLPNNGRIPAKFVDLKPGECRPIGGDLNHPSQADEIVKQLRVFGAIDASEANRLPRMKVAYVFQRDRPISDAIAAKVYNHNKAVLSDDGRRRREAAAIAAASVIDSPEAKISVEQIEESEQGGKMLAEGFTVDKAADASGIEQRGGDAKRLKPGKPGRRAEA